MHGHIVHQKIEHRRCFFIFSAESLSLSLCVKIFPYKRRSTQNPAHLEITSRKFVAQSQHISGFGVVRCLCGREGRGTSEGKPNKCVCLVLVLPPRITLLIESNKGKIENELLNLSSRCSAQPKHQKLRPCALDSNVFGPPKYSCPAAEESVRRSTVGHCDTVCVCVCKCKDAKF